MLTSEMNIPSFKFRWHNAQCLEIRLPNGKYIVTDPFVTTPITDNPKLDHWRDPDFTFEDFEGADYIIVNHQHTDHNMDLGNLQKKFDSIVIVQSQVALEVARVFDIPFTRIYPVDNESTYFFHDFQLDTFHGRHAHTPECWSTGFDPGKVDFGRDDMSVLAHYGSMFNTNFVLTLPDNTRIGFSAGYIDDLLKKWDHVRPNVLFRHLMFKPGDGGVEDFEEVLVDSGAQLIVPIHLEGTYHRDPEQINRWVEETNRYAEEKGCSGRCMHPIKHRWYEMSLMVNPL